MRKFLGWVAVLCGWVVELNEIATDWLMRVLSAFARRVSLVAVLVVGGGVTYKMVEASRNSSGTMSGISGPYTAGTVISSSILNARFADIESEISDSKSRSGKGDFSAPVRGADGTSTAPTYSFTSETTAGLYRAGSGDLRMTFNATESCRWTSLGIRCANGAVATPSLSFFNDTGAGLYRIGSNNIGFAINGAKVSEWAAGGFTTTVASVNGGITLLTGNTANFTSYALGRAASEFQIGISNGSNGYCVGTSAGDTCLVTSAGTKAIFFDTNGGVNTPSLKIGAGNGAVTLNNGVGVDGSGFKHQNHTGCATAASIGATCTDTLTWTTTFADTSYEAVCSCNAVTSGQPLIRSYTIAASNIVITTVALTAAAAQCSVITCFAAHQ